MLNSARVFVQPQVTHVLIMYPYRAAPVLIVCLLVHVHVCLGVCLQAEQERISASLKEKEQEITEQLSKERRDSDRKRFR